MKRELLGLCMGATVACAALGVSGCGAGQRPQHPEGVPPPPATVPGPPGAGLPVAPGVSGSPRAIEGLPPGIGLRPPAVAAAAILPGGRIPIRDAKTAAQHQLRQMEDSLSVNLDPLWRFVKLSDLARLAYEAGELEKARTYAEHLLNEAPKYEGQFGYQTGVHHANIVLGRVALRSGDVASAREHLLQSARAAAVFRPTGFGPARLSSFGPNMSLAKEMLDRGERGAVLEYLEVCRAFWDSGQETLQNWTAQIREGKNPDFGLNLIY